MKNEAWVDIAFAARQKSNEDVLKASIEFGPKMAERQSLEDYIFNSLELFQKRNPVIQIEKQRTHYLKGKPSKILLVLKGELAFSKRTKKYLKQELIYAFKYFEPVDFLPEEMPKAESVGTPVSQTELAKVVEKEMAKQYQTLFESLQEAQSGEEQLKKELRSFMTSELQANQDIFMERILAVREPQAALKDIRLILQELVHGELQELQKHFFEKLNSMLAEQLNKMDWRTRFQTVLQEELMQLQNSLATELAGIKEQQNSILEVKEKLQERIEQAGESVQLELQKLQAELTSTIQTTADEQSSDQLQQLIQTAIQEEFSQIKDSIDRYPNADEIKSRDFPEEHSKVKTEEKDSVNAATTAEDHTEQAVQSGASVSETVSKDHPGMDYLESENEVPAPGKGEAVKTIVNPLIEAVEQKEQIERPETDRHRMYDEMISASFDDLHMEEELDEVLEALLPEVVVTELDQDYILRDKHEKVQEAFQAAEKEKNIFRKPLEIQNYRNAISNVEVCEFRWMQLLSEVEQVVERYRLNDFSQKIENVGFFLDEIQSKARKVSLSDSKIKVPKNLIAELTAYHLLSEYLLYILEKNK